MKTSPTPPIVILLQEDPNEYGLNRWTAEVGFGNLMHSTHAATPDQALTMMSELLTSDLIAQLQDKTAAIMKR